ncbi:MAG: hypothetical protein E4G93_03540 [Dehalococcoidia bacterium]|nr:MAG: hypothetical protein E4G93_03540 [Dehalococcoidia bacterium]
MVVDSRHIRGNRDTKSSDAQDGADINAMTLKNWLLGSARILSVGAVVALLTALVPSSALAQTCVGGYCGSGEGLESDTKVEVHVSITVSPEEGGMVLVNGTEPEAGVFSALQGDVLVLEAIPEPGYEFGGWNDWFSESTSVVEAPIYNHKTLTANFVEVAENPAPVEDTGTPFMSLPKGTTLDQRGNEFTEVFVEMRQPRALPSSGVLVSDVFNLKPDSATFDPPIPISLPYDVGSLPSGVDEAALSVAVFDAGIQDWILLPSEVDSEQHVIVTEVSHFSEFGIVAPLPPGAAPLITPGFSFSSLSVSPSQAPAGEHMAVTVQASYIGSNSQTHTRVFVTVDGQIADEKEIVLSPGDNVAVTLTVVAPAQQGTYTVDVNGLSAAVTVTTAAPEATALTQAIALADQDRFEPLNVAAPSLLSKWRPAAYVAGALVALLLIGPLLRSLRRRTLRYRYDL